MSPNYRLIVNQHDTAMVLVLR